MRTLLVLLAVVAFAPWAPAQGIRSVTRRTTTLERQQPARGFFDAAGLDVTGAPATGVRTPQPAQPTAAPRQPGSFATRPPVTLPPISQRIARPQVAQTRPAVPNTAPRALPALRPPPKTPAPAKP